MPRFLLTIEYDGTPYVGWQRQDNGATVQGEIEAALARLGEVDTLVYGAGRTDTGVHATGQVAHVDLQRDWETHKLCGGVNSMLRPRPISVLSALKVDDDVHARFSATGRHYLYRIVNRQPNLALEQTRAWHVKMPLDEAAMDEAAQVLIGTHDFTTFRSARCQSKSPVKTLSRLNVLRKGDVVEIVAHAPSFLHNQVRSLAGALRKVGDGSWTKADLKASLEAASREACAPVAPPHGLYLTKVDYPRNLNL